MPLPAYLRQQALLMRLRQAGTQPVPADTLRCYVLEQSAAADYAQGYSGRTLQRDLAALPERFGVVVKVRRHEGHYIAETEALTPAQQQLNEALALRAFYALPESLGPFVQPEARQARGLEHLRPLLRAAQARQLVAFDYQKFWHDYASPRTCGPLLLREFRGRWYVLAVMAGSGYLACFGLDRIQGLVATGQLFVPPADFDATTYFADCFGVTRPTDGQEPEEIRLRFAEVQGRYAVSFPLHPSQRLVADAGGKIDLSLTVYDTHDLRMELLSYGAEVEVLAPAALRQWQYDVPRGAASA